MKISIERLKKEHKINIDYEDNQFEDKSLRESTSGPLKINFTIILVGNNNIRIVGKIIGDFDLTCDRCIENYVEHKEIKTDDVFELEQEELKTKMLNLDNRVKDIVTNNFLMKNLCSPDCKGICLGCKVNLNKEECKCK